MKSAFRSITALRLASGRARVCFVTPTNICNAKCSFCEVWHIKKTQHAPIEDLRRALDHLLDIGVGFVQFTGGEPLLYPDLEAAVRHAHQIGLVVNVISNGSLLRGQSMEGLLSAGMDVLALSVDHHDPLEHEKSRGIPGLWKTIENAVSYFRRARIPVLASTVIARFNHHHLDQLVETVRNAGFSGIGFTYPTLETNSSYPVGRNSESLQLTQKELEAALFNLLALKSEGFPIFNTRRGIKDQLRRVQGDPSRYPCLAGDRVLFLDHRLQLQRCMVLEEDYGSVFDVRPHNLPAKPSCDGCSMMCFREPSLLSGGIDSVPAILEHAWLAVRTQVMA